MDFVLFFYSCLSYQEFAQIFNIYNDNISNNLLLTSYALSYTSYARDCIRVILKIIE